MTVLAYSPLGLPPVVSGKALAQRPPTLDGKTLYLIDGRFDHTEEFMMQLKDWFEQNHPEINTRLVRWKEPFAHDPETAEEVRANADAAVFGVGICSTCAPAVAGHTMKLESEYGVPTVGIHTHVFSRLAASATRVNGMPGTRFAFVPQPIANQTPEQLRAKVEGDDPINSRPFIQQLLDGLTSPLTASDTKGQSFERTTERLVTADSEEALHALFGANGWTDNLPIVIPTEERVEQMLAATSHDRNEVVGIMRPTAYREFWQFTVEQVAINAVMAGARPEYFPVVLALLSSGITARHSSSTSMATMAAINGPIRAELGMNSGIGALGPYNHANATIGRAWGLACANVQGGSVPGTTYLGSTGNSLNYASPVFAENEERSPWEPLHVRQGHAPDASTASIFTYCYSWVSNWGIRETWKERMRQMLLSLDPCGGALFVLDPLAANRLVEEGFDAPSALVQWVFENAQKPAREWWDTFDVQTNFAPMAAAGIEPWASYQQLGPDELIPMFQPDDVEVVVVGGETQPQWSIVSAVSDHGVPRGSLGEVGKTVVIDEWR